MNLMGTVISIIPLSTLNGVFDPAKIPAWESLSLSDEIHPTRFLAHDIVNMTTMEGIMGFSYMGGRLNGWFLFGRSYYNG